MQESPVIIRPGMGWIPSVPDIRDIPFRARPRDPEHPLPVTVDLRPQLPEIGNQGTIGSCTAWAAVAAYRSLLLREGRPDFDASELAQYYWSRQLERSVNADAGATIRTAFKVMGKIGLAPEHEWEYAPGRVFETPPPRVRRLAEMHQAIQYEAVAQTDYAIKAAIAEGFPVVCGIGVYSSFYRLETTQTGLVQLPALSDSLEGGHAILIPGYGFGEAGDLYLFRNSWGVAWGQRGYGYLPSAYLLDARLGSDFWVVRTVEG